MLPPSTELLSFYRHRLKEFEKERETMLTKMNAIEVSHEELHRTQWDLRVRQEEIAELQRALSDANVYLFDEREQVLKLQAENDQLKIQELEDRRRIQHLLALTQPVSQEVTFFRDCRPAKMTRFPVDHAKESLRSQADSVMRDPGESLSMAKHASSKSASRSSMGGRSRRGGNTSRGSVGGGAVRVPGNTSGSSAISGVSSQPFKNRVLRTIYLPSEKADTLLLTVESLQKQLQSVKELETGRNAALLEDRRKRLEEERVRAAADREQVEALQDTVRRVEDKLRMATKDYLETRHMHQVHARVMKEENETLKAQNADLIRQLQEERRRSVVENEAVKAAAEEESQMYTEQFRQEAQAREEDLCVLKEHCAELQTMYKERVAKLEEQLASLNARYKQLSHRRQMDFEGYGADVAILRKQLARMEAVIVQPRKGRRKGRAPLRRSQTAPIKDSSDFGGSKSHITHRPSSQLIHMVESSVEFPSSSNESSLKDREIIGGSNKKPVKLESDLQGLRARLASLEGQITNIMGGVDEETENMRDPETL
jgi:coiled-coil domain-containing protein 77